MEHNSQTKTCQNKDKSKYCMGEFTITPDDFLFYEKMKVPPPTFCPTCRFQRRLTYFNQDKLYNRTCSLCNKNIVSMFRQDTPFRVHCNSCWWGDSFDGLESGVDYNPDISFFEQLIKLRDKTNFMQLETLFPSLVNTEYTQNSGYQKNCFMTFFADYNENCLYLTLSAHTTNSVDCYRIKDSENCYGSIGLFKCYNTFFSEECDSCFDIYYSRNLSGCSNCILCMNLKNQSYMILNKKYSKEEYEKIKNELNIDTIKGSNMLQNKAYEFFKKFPERSYMGNSLNINVSGEYIYESKNTRNAYLVSGVEDSKYVSFLTLPKTTDCFDYTGWGSNSSMLYECFTVGEGAYNNKFSSECWPNPMNLEYCHFAQQSKNCFGCINVKKKEYCILNKQYTKEEYEVLKDKIITDMGKNVFISKRNNTVYKYGEFFPEEFSPFSYNETVANYLLPLEENLAKREGLNWFSDEKNKYSETSNINLLLETKTKDLSDNIIGEIFKCTSCNNGFKIVKDELYFIKKFNVSIPNKCYKCRQIDRLKRCNGFNIYNRECFNCKKKIETSYAKNRPEIVYCDLCYKKEIY